MLNSKPLTWLGSTKRDLLGLPKEIIREIGHSLNLAQSEIDDPDCKIFKGYAGGSVREIVKDDPGGTYRAIFTVKFKESIYVLHVFQKKSKEGRKTTKQDVELIKKRYKEAELLHKSIT